jgi:hypothetical protein
MTKPFAVITGASSGRLERAASDVQSDTPAAAPLLPGRPMENRVAGPERWQRSEASLRLEDPEADA